jgi:hypothetical protein
MLNNQEYKEKYLKYKKKCIVIDLKMINIKKFMKTV